jgi:hypothetical protein
MRLGAKQQVPEQTSQHNVRSGTSFLDHSVNGAEQSSTVLRDLCQILTKFHIAVLASKFASE